jgi:hypothetical protein
MVLFIDFLVKHKGFYWDFPYNIVYSCSATPLIPISNRISNLS